MKKKEVVRYIVILLTVVSMLGMLVACQKATPTPTTPPPLCKIQ